jgi:hypothetical protein
MRCLASEKDEPSSLVRCAAMRTEGELLVDQDLVYLVMLTPEALS